MPRTLARCLIYQKLCQPGNTESNLSKYTTNQLRNFLPKQILHLPTPLVKKNYKTNPYGLIHPHSFYVAIEPNKLSL